MSQRTEVVLGALVRAARARFGLTQRQVAEAVDCGVPYISKIEAGLENPSDAVIYRLADVLYLDGDLLILCAGRVPQRYVAHLTADPVRALLLLRNAFSQEDPA